MKKTALVITTIYYPTKAIIGYSRQSDIELLIIGDKKTPDDWSVHNAFFCSIEQQINLGFSICAHLPFNHYSRKNIGYILAKNRGAEKIFDTDDDNVPYSDFFTPLFDGIYPFVKNRNGFINIYSHYTDQNIWPRGLPLNLINDQAVNITKDELSERNANIGIWQGLADGDPDVDAIYRLTDNAGCVFNKNGNIALPVGTVSPFNSQNTIFRKELFPLLYIPTTVTMRFSDILRGLVAQPIMWLYGYNLGIMEATVYQERNIHNYFNDFVDEIPCYINCGKIVGIVKEHIKPSFSITDNLQIAYEDLYKNEIVRKSELNVVKYWVEDIQ